MELDGKPGAFFGTEIGFRMGDLLAHQFAAAFRDQPVQKADPDEAAEQNGEERSDDDEKPLGRPPGRTGENADVGFGPRDDRRTGDARKGRVRPPVLRFHQADAADLEYASGYDVLKGVGKRVGDHRKLGSVVVQHGAMKVFLVRRTADDRPRHLDAASEVRRTHLDPAVVLLHHGLRRDGRRRGFRFRCARIEFPDGLGQVDAEKVGDGESGNQNVVTVMGQDLSVAEFDLHEPSVVSLEDQAIAAPGGEDASGDASPSHVGEDRGIDVMGVFECGDVERVLRCGTEDPDVVPSGDLEAGTEIASLTGDGPADADGGDFGSDQAVQFLFGDAGVGEGDRQGHAALSDEHVVIATVDFIRKEVADGSLHADERPVVVGTCQRSQGDVGRRGRLHVSDDGETVGDVLVLHDAVDVRMAGHANDVAGCRRCRGMSDGDGDVRSFNGHHE